MDTRDCYCTVHGMFQRIVFRQPILYFLSCCTFDTAGASRTHLGLRRNKAEISAQAIPYVGEYFIDPLSFEPYITCVITTEATQITVVFPGALLQLSAARFTRFCYVASREDRIVRNSRCRYSSKGRRGLGPQRGIYFRAIKPTNDKRVCV